MFTFKMSEKQARNVHEMAKGHCGSLKNWIVSAVESGDLPRAKTLAAELREFQALFAAFNIDAKHDIAKYTGKPIVTEITVEERAR